jgi:hypothetical protein
MKHFRTVAAASVGALGLALLVAVTPASAASLPGSIFEIDQGASGANLVVDTAGNQDWASIPQGSAQGTERRQADLASGSGDDSFGNGTKEDTLVPSVIDGSIPPNKSDLKFFGGYLETNANGRFLNIYWSRVQDPNGTTNMDFELNKSSTLSSNGVTPVRTAGDVLIQYDLANGGTVPELFLSRWVATGAGSQCQANNSTPCWGTRVNLSAAGDAIGSINLVPISAANADGLGSLSARTFGEAQIDFDALAGGGDQCVAFGSAYLKSRSSDSFTAAIKDFIRPIATNFSQCGSVHVIKHDDATPPALLAGAQFNLVKDNAPVGGAPGAEDTVVASCTTVAGVCDFTAVTQGEYWVVETVAPVGHNLPSPPYQHVTVVADVQVSVTFVDPRQRGAIRVTKTAKHAASATGILAQSGVTFTIGGTTAVTDANGQACVDGFLFGQYAVTETVPTGYLPAGDTTKNVTVDNQATCAGTPYAGEDVAFVNNPLTDVSVVINSQVVGGTDTDVSCTNGGPNGNTDATGDGTFGVTGLTERTIVCTIIIDP